eukprot:jgi/Botrbrau1/10719/Bobra.357_1s0021.1
MDIDDGDLGRSPQLSDQEGQGGGSFISDRHVSGPARHICDTGELIPQDNQKDKDSGLVLPVSRVRKIIKQVIDVRAISADAVFVIARATELLLDDIAARAGQHVGNNNYLEYDDVAAAIQGGKVFRFLRDVVPQRVSLKYLLEKLEQQDAFTRDGGGASDGDGDVDIDDLQEGRAGRWPEEHGEDEDV